jgi:NADH-quinone oxidoreductase subunit J
MPVLEIVFYLFSAVLLASSVSVVTVGNPIYAVLFLVLAFFSAACIWLVLQAEFLAIVLVLVYVGAVMVLFLFVVMMLDVKTSPGRAGFTRYLPLGLLVAAAMALQLLLAIWAGGMDNPAFPEPHPQGYSHTTELGILLYTRYLYAFEIAAVLLLVAIIAAIALTHRRRESTRYQDPAKQVTIQRSERVRLVEMSASGTSPEAPSSSGRSGQERE